MPPKGIMTVQNDLQTLTDTLLKIVDRYEKFAKKETDIHLPHVEIIDGLMEKIKNYPISGELLIEQPTEIKPIQVLHGAPVETEAKTDLPIPVVPIGPKQRMTMDEMLKSETLLEDPSRESEDLPKTELKK